MHTATVYICDRCGGKHDFHKWIFSCLGGCGTEICEDCMWSWGHCEECAKEKSDADQLKSYKAMYEKSDADQLKSYKAMYGIEDETQ